MLLTKTFCGLFLLVPHAVATAPSDHTMLPEGESQGQEACHVVSLIQTGVLSSLSSDGHLIGGYNNSGATAMASESSSLHSDTPANILLQEEQKNTATLRNFLSFSPVTQYLMLCAATWLLWSLLGILVACCCFSGEPATLFDAEDPVEAFERSHFACMKTPKILCCACCCPAVQWAETMHLAGLLRLPLAILMFNAAAIMNSMVFMGIMTMGACTGLTIISYRQNLREKLGAKALTWKSCAFDCLYVCCCPCLAITQEAQVVRYAYQQNQGGGVAYKSDTLRPTAGESSDEAVAPNVARTPVGVKYLQGVPQSQSTLVTVPTTVIVPNATLLSMSNVPLTTSHPSPPSTPTSIITMPAPAMQLPTPTTITMSAPATQLPTSSLSTLPANRISSLSSAPP